MTARKRNRAAALAPRARPVQGRSRDSIRRILDATHLLLRRDGAAAVTTPAIARAADVSVGSIYHFFPNKESIVLALYEEKLAHIREIAGAPIVVKRKDWRTGFRNWVRMVKQREAEIEYDIAMNEAMQHFFGREQISREHAVRLADILVGKMKALGSTWADEALFDLAVHVFCLNQSLWLYWSFAGHPLQHGIDRLADSAIALMAPAIENAPPPPPPYATRRSHRARS